MCAFTGTKNKMKKYKIEEERRK